MSKLIIGDYHAEKDRIQQELTSAARLRYCQKNDRFTNIDEEIINIVIAIQWLHYRYLLKRIEAKLHKQI